MTLVVFSVLWTVLVCVKLPVPCVLVCLVSRLEISPLSVLRLVELVLVLVVLFVVLLEIYGLVSGLKFNALSTVCMPISVL